MLINFNIDTEYYLKLNVLNIRHHNTHTPPWLFYLNLKNSPNTTSEHQIIEI